jgi:hypothetical protein
MRPTTSLTHCALSAVMSAAISTASAAQSFVLTLPLKSQAATVSQTIGLTDITIVYHRPLVNDRKIWDGVVPYGKVWRVGANMNTTIAFSDPVTINGQRLDRGTYGLHMIPTADAWTIIFSRNSTSWGSFTYDSTEDALRVSVAPRPAPVHNAMTFEFDQLQPTSAVVELEWEKIAVPFTVAVDVQAVTLASFRKQLRTLERYTWTSWDDASTYLLGEHSDLDLALAYADTSIQTEDHFENEMTRSKVLTALNRPSDAAAAQAKALSLGSAAQVHAFARELLGAKRNAEAYAIFRANAARSPDQWVVHDGLARMYSARGQFAAASREVNIALHAAPVGRQAYLQGLVKDLDARRDINNTP